MQNTPNTNLLSAAVKVMRSFDYCHFEIALSISLEGDTTPSATVDNLRKDAMRLADKAVKQYQIAKRHAEKLVAEEYQREEEVERARRIRETPEQDRTVAGQAFLKAFDDAAWAASRAYDYEDNYE